MKHGGCSISPLGTFEDKVPADVKDKVKAREEAIKNGSFVVEINDEEPKSS
jgi:basic membrane lipoprotein Med (substrate-binding protein (PBP1-ABC) superfamily)